ncbi:hypothetical protein VCHA37P193_10315 [Vibrio chagasii]|nr:hypothetical protein VCHA37P193_10315 [Vibrio chagasii]
MPSKPVLMGLFKSYISTLMVVQQSMKSVTIGEFIERSWGEEAFIKLIKSNGDVSGITNEPIESLFSGWKDFVKNTYLSSPQSEYEKALERSPLQASEQ